MRHGPALKGAVYRALSILFLTVPGAPHFAGLLRCGCAGSVPAGKPQRLRVGDTLDEAFDDLAEGIPAGRSDRSAARSAAPRANYATFFGRLNDLCDYRLRCGLWRHSQI